MLKNFAHHLQPLKISNRSIIKHNEINKIIIRRFINYLIRTDEPKELDRILRNEKSKLINWKEKSSKFFMRHMKHVTRTRSVEPYFQQRTKNRLWSRFLDCTNYLNDAEEEYKKYEQQAHILTKATNTKTLIKISDKFDRLKKLDPLDYRKVLTLTNDVGAISSRNTKQCCPVKSFSEFVHTSEIIKTTGSELIVYSPPTRKKKRFRLNVEDFANNYFSLRRSKDIQY